MYFFKSFFKVLATSSVGFSLIELNYSQKCNENQLKTTKNILSKYEQASVAINRFMVLSKKNSI